MWDCARIVSSSARNSFRVWGSFVYFRALFLDLMTWGSRGYAICRLVGCASHARNDVPCEEDVKWCEEWCWSFFYDLNLVNYFSTLIPLIPMCETMRGTSFPCEERLFRARNVAPIFLCLVCFNLFLFVDVEALDLLFMTKGYVLGMIDELAQYP